MEGEERGIEVRITGNGEVKKDCRSEERGRRERRVG